jgi:hypothetical protein
MMKGVLEAVTQGTDCTGPERKIVPTVGATLALVQFDLAFWP